MKRWTICAEISVLLMLFGCWGAEEPLQADTGDVRLDTEENVYDPAALVVEGHVSILGSGATDTVVTLRCDDKTVETVTDDDGDYSLTADVQGCERFAMEFVKNSYLTNMRVVDLPLFRSPVTVDVPLAELEELQCGSEYCTTQNSKFDNMDVIAQGWLGTKTGRDLLEFVPGEFKDTEGTPLFLVGVGDMGFIDIGGKPVDKLEDLYVCIKLKRDALDWMGDTDLSTAEVENRAYRLDRTTGRWATLPLPALIAYRLGDRYTKDDEGKCEYIEDGNGKPLPNWVPLERENLKDVRAETYFEDNPCSRADPPSTLYISEYSVCMPVDRTDIFAAGIPMPRKSCFNMSVRNQCGEPIRGAAFSFQGRDHGYRAEGWTDENGTVCLEAIGSEPVGEDLDMDGLGGETFWVDATLDPPEGSFVRMNDVETALAVPGAEGCAEPSACVQLSETVREYGACD